MVLRLTSFRDREILHAIYQIGWRHWLGSMRCKHEMDTLNADKLADGRRWFNRVAEQTAMAIPPLQLVSAGRAADVWQYSATARKEPSAKVDRRTKANRRPCDSRKFRTLSMA